MKILIVIVLYHCELQNSKTYQTFNRKEESLLVFDNSEKAQDITSYTENALYIHNESNIGLSACYNQAAVYAKEQGYDWLLFLDQDTDFSGVSIDDYLSAISAHPECKLVAPMVKCGVYTMSPMKYKHHFALFSKNTYKGVVDVKDLSIINSGLCVSLEAFEKSGGYNETVFLDYSDHEFLRRFKRHYSLAFILPNIIYQDYSAKSDNAESSLKRLVLFCESIRGCEKNSLKERLEFAIPILKRTLALVVRNHTLRPFFIAYKHYFNKR